MTQNEIDVINRYTRLMSQTKRIMKDLVDNMSVTNSYENQTSDIDHLAELLNRYSRYNSLRDSVLTFAKLREDYAHETH